MINLPLEKVFYFHFQCPPISRGHLYFGQFHGEHVERFVKIYGVAQQPIMEDDYKIFSNEKIRNVPRPFKKQLFEDCIVISFQQLDLLNPLSEDVQISNGKVASHVAHLVGSCMLQMNFDLIREHGVYLHSFNPSSIYYNSLNNCAYTFDFSSLKCVSDLEQAKLEARGAVVSLLENISNGIGQPRYLEINNTEAGKNFYNFYNQLKCCDSCDPNDFPVPNDIFTSDLDDICAKFGTLF